MRALLLVALAVIPAAVMAVRGGDVSQATSQSTFSCAVSNGNWQFAITRSYQSFGQPDPNAASNIANAKAAGIQYVDAYHFPCYGGVDPTQQVNDDVNAISGQFGTLWFDIETNPSSGCGWSSDTNANCQFLTTMIQAGQSLGISMGVYTSSYMWSSIMGSCTAGADAGLPLWYAHYDQSPSFSDFSPYGGWSTPAMKQYWDSTGLGCGIGADADWYP